MIMRDEEQARQGKDIEAWMDTLKLMHSPKTAPVVEAELKFSKNKTSSKVLQNVDELHLHDKIGKLKSYFKSAQGLIADELSREAAYINKFQSPNNIKSR